MSPLAREIADLICAVGPMTINDISRLLPPHSYNSIYSCIDREWEQGNYTFFHQDGNKPIKVYINEEYYYIYRDR